MKRKLITLMIVSFFAYSAFAQNVDNQNIKKEKTDQAEVKKTEKVIAEEKIDLPTFTKKELKIPEDKSLSNYINDSVVEEKPAEEVDFNIDIEGIKNKEQKVKEEKEIKHKYEVLFSVNVESLTNNFGTWRTASLFTSRKSRDGKILWGEFRASERRDKRDTEVVGGIYQPLPNRYAFTVESSFSNTNKFVPKFSIRGEGEKVFKGGWVGHIGFRYKEYSPVDVKTVYTQVEKYWGNHRLAYTFNVNNVSNAGTAPSNTLSYNKYYGERLNTYGFTASVGKEEEFVGPIAGVTRSNTFSLTGSVKQWITDDFGMFVDATLHRQGTFYYRRGLNFGVRYRF